MSSPGRIYRTTETGRTVPCCWTIARCPDHAATPVRGGRVYGGLSRSAVTAGAR